MKQYRNLTAEEISKLKSQACYAEDWNNIKVAEGFDTNHVVSTRFSGKIRIGAFKSEFKLAGGMTKHSGLYHTTLHNVTIGDNCCIENVKNYIANYEIGDNCFIENVDIILTDGPSTFGNGVEAAVMSETGGREVMFYDRLSAQQAYVMALYRHRSEAIAKLRQMILDYCDFVRSDMGRIENNVTIVDAGYIKNVKIGPYAKIEGCSRIKNGSINSEKDAPVHIGVGVIGDDFVICSGSNIEDNVMFSRCFIGQSVKLGYSYSATDSLFFSNCQGENGEACSIFAGPFTVTHHKSTLLIAGMFSFMNAGSGSNQSNHIYKLGPIHQGIMERGAKTASDSYLLWPAKVGAFSLVIGRHASHQDTSNLPFSYLIEDQNVSYIIPGANLRSVGTVRDAKKWPKRDTRTSKNKLDCINYNLLSPFTIRKMLKGIDILNELRRVSGVTSEIYTYQSGKIKRSSLEKGLEIYSMAINKFLGNSLISRIQKVNPKTLDELHRGLLPTSDVGTGKWVDAAGLIAPKSEIDKTLDDIESGVLKDVDSINARFYEMHSNYYDYEWTWAYGIFEKWYGIDLSKASIESLLTIIRNWKEAVVTMDKILIQDAHKEFSLSMMTSFGADGDSADRQADFEQVRGSSFETNPFVQSIREHIIVKTELCETATEIVESLV
jgi:NDP-sugar pyrophosphorylase family protein